MLLVVCQHEVVSVFKDPVTIFAPVSMGNFPLCMAMFVAKDANASMRGAIIAAKVSRPEVVKTFEPTACQTINGSPLMICGTTIQQSYRSRF